MIHPLLAAPHRHVTDAGPLALIDNEDDADDAELLPVRSWRTHPTCITRTKKEPFT